MSAPAPITAARRLLPARCPRWCPAFGGSWSIGNRPYGWQHGQSWDQQEGLAGRSYWRAHPGDPLRGDAHASPSWPGRLCVSADPSGETCAQKLVWISPRFRRRRCSCGLFRISGMDKAPICTDGLEHRRRGCIRVRRTLELSDLYSGAELERAREHLGTLKRLAGMASKEEAN